MDEIIQITERSLRERSNASSELLPVSFDDIERHEHWTGESSIKWLRESWVVLAIELSEQHIEAVDTHLGSRLHSRRHHRAKSELHIFYSVFGTFRSSAILILCCESSLGEELCVGLTSYQYRGRINREISPVWQVGMISTKRFPVKWLSVKISLRSFVESEIGKSEKSFCQTKSDLIWKWLDNKCLLLGKNMRPDLHQCDGIFEDFWEFGKLWNALRKT